MTRCGIGLLVITATLLRAASAWGLTAAEREKAWEDLGAGQETVVAAAQAKLVGEGQPGIAFVMGKLIGTPDAASVRARIKELESGEFRTREAAQAWLMGQGKAVEELLQAGLKDTKSEEATARLTRMLARLATMKRPEGSEAQRQARAIRVVEIAGTREQLDEVAGRSAWESTREEAKGAIERVSRRQIEAALADLEAKARRGEDVATGLEQTGKLVANAQLAWDEGYRQRMAAASKTAESMQRAGTLAEQIKTGAKDRAVREELVRLWLVALDRPEEAVKWMDEGTDARARQLAALAAKDVVVLTAGQLAEVGEWYIALAKQAKVAAEQAAMLRRARGYLMAVVRTTAPAAEKAAAVKRLGNVDQQLADLPGEGGWREMLGAVAMNKHVVAGTWKREAGGGVMAEAGDFAVLKVPVSPAGSYELKVKWARMSGEDGVIIAFPVGAHRGNLNIGGWGNTITGLEHINGAMADADNLLEAKASRREGIVNKRVYEYLIRVETKGVNAKVSVAVDGKPFVSWEGPQAAWSMHGVWDKDQTLDVLVGAHRSEAAFRSVKVRSLDGGKIEERRKPAKVAVPVAPAGGGVLEAQPDDVMEEGGE